MAAFYARGARVPNDDLAHLVLGVRGTPGGDWEAGGTICGELAWSDAGAGGAEETCPDCFAATVRMRDVVPAWVAAELDEEGSRG